MIEVDPDYKIDERRIDYLPYQSEVARLIQMPESQITANAITNAYMADWRKSRKDNKQ